MSEWPHFDFGDAVASRRIVRRKTVPRCRRSPVVEYVKNEQTKRRRTADFSQCSTNNNDDGHMCDTENR